MRVIPPVTITSTNLFSSSIPEPDATQNEIAFVEGTTSLGEQRIVISTHLNYEVVATPDTTDDPVTGAAKDVPTWVVIGPTNRFAMFDTVIGTQSKHTTNLTIEIQNSDVLNSIASFNIVGASQVIITVTDPTEGVVFTQTIEMFDNQAVVDFYEYFFSPIVPLTEFVIFGMPAYNEATIKTEYIGDAGIDVGTLIVGNEIVLGEAIHPTSLELLDFSVKETDEFGAFKIEPRRNSKRVNFEFILETRLIGFVNNTLSSLLTVPAVWQGASSTRDSSLVYGFYRGGKTTRSNNETSKGALEIEGLT